MSEYKDNHRLLEVIAQSSRPYFLSTGTFSGESFDSIIILEDATISTLTDEEGVNVAEATNCTSIVLPAGTVITWQSPMNSVTTDALIQINRKNAN